MLATEVEPVDLALLALEVLSIGWEAADAGSFVHQFEPPRPLQSSRPQFLQCLTIFFLGSLAAAVVEAEVAALAFSANFFFAFSCKSANCSGEMAALSCELSSGEPAKSGALALIAGVFNGTVASGVSMSSL